MAGFQAPPTGRFSAPADNKELRMIALVYNLVRLVMLKSAARQRVPIERISFIDAQRWLTHAGGGPDLDQLALVPH